jgi:hypothetical protein
MAYTYHTYVWLNVMIASLRRDTDTLGLMCIKYMEFGGKPMNFDDYLVKFVCSPNWLIMLIMLCGS